MTWKPDYATSAELKSFIRVNDSDDDAQIALAITAASRTIDRATSRQFGVLAVAAPRYYTARFDHERARWLVEVDDLMTTSGLLVAVDSACDQTYTGSVTAYDLGPRNAVADGKPYTQLVVRPSSSVSPTLGEDAVRITALWGWSAVPDTIKQATLLQASRVLSRRDSPYGVAGSPEMGSEMRLLAKLDADVDLMVRPYRRAWGALVAATSDRQRGYAYGAPFYPWPVI